MNRILQLDIGNTAIKWRFLVSGEIRSRGYLLNRDIESFRKISCHIDLVDTICIASVASADFNEEISVCLRDIFDRDIWFASSDKALAGVTNGYDNPSELGVDRWLAIVAAWSKFNKALIVVDAGTALTIDIVDGQGIHLGGYIVPGRDLMELSLSIHTSGVLFERRVDPETFPGKTTTLAVNHGITLAQVGALKMVLGKLLGGDLFKVDEPPIVVFSGGGGKLLRNLSGIDSLWFQDLVFEGLEIAAQELL